MSDLSPRYPPHGPSHARRLDSAMVDYLKQECKRVGIPLDTYDNWYIYGTLQKFLEENNAALTGRGVKRFRTRGRFSRDG